MGGSFRIVVYATLQGVALLAKHVIPKVYAIKDSMGGLTTKRLKGVTMTNKKPIVITATKNVRHFVASPCSEDARIYNCYHCRLVYYGSSCRQFSVQNLCKGGRRGYFI